MSLGEITKESLINKYGSGWFSIVNENCSSGWIDLINNSNHQLYLEQVNILPLGLEKKISLHWFQHFFIHNDWRRFKVSLPDGVSFHGNWLDVPFPNSTEIKLSFNYRGEDTITLNDPSYNWYELFIFIDELMWRQGRVLDIGITGLSLKDISPSRKVIEIDWSS